MEEFFLANLAYLHYLCHKNTENQPFYMIKRVFKKLSCTYVWGNILAIFIFILLLCFGVRFGLDYYTHHGESIVVPNFVNKQLDYGILEKSDNVYVMEGTFGWADLGTWHGIYEATAKTADDNVLVDTEGYLNDSRNNIIKLPRGRKAIISGLDGYIVAEQDDVLLICRKEDSSAIVRKLANEVKIEQLND